MEDKRGYLVLIGGAEDRKDRMVILRRILELTSNRNVVVVPSATSYTADAISDYRDVFFSIGASMVDGIDIQSRYEAERDDYSHLLDDAGLIFFTGGDQTRLVDSLWQTKTMEIIRKRFKEGATIAGTSAGAAAASDPMIYDGDDEGFSKSAVKHTRGFGFLKEITVDTHFLQRERIPRLSQFLSSGLSQKGIGLNEDTAIFISPDNKFEVVGSGTVTVMNSENMKYSSYDDVNRNEPISVDGVEIGFLAEGSVFDLDRWKIDKEINAILPKYEKSEYREYRETEDEKRRRETEHDAESRRDRTGEKPAEYARESDRSRYYKKYDRSKSYERSYGSGRGKRAGRGRR